MAAEERTDCAQSSHDFECTSQFSLAQFSNSSKSLMSWSEVEHEVASDLSDSLASIECAVIAFGPVDMEQNFPGPLPDSTETCLPETWSLGLPLSYGNRLKSRLYVKGVEFEERVGIMIAQFADGRVSLPMLVVSNVLLFTVGIFIGRRTSCKVL